MNATINQVSAGWRVLAREHRGAYEVSLARGDLDVLEAQRLRFDIFNLERGEGLASSHALGRDVDDFDDVCEHLLVRTADTGELVGTYRMQDGLTAEANYNYYSAQEFDLSRLEPLRIQTLELGRACIHRDHRNTRVLAALWRAIAQYARDNHLRYLIGCSSVTSQDETAGWALYQELQQKYSAPEQFRVEPRDSHRCRPTAPASASLRVPKLLRAYLSLGACICGAPAIDREFGTIDFLTLLDLQQLNPAMARLYLGMEC